MPAILVGSMLLLLGQGTGSRVFAAEVTAAQDEQTGLKSWTWREQGVSIQLLQLLPDQTRAFFLARGFTAAAADRIARACVFQSIFRNDGERALRYDLDDWSVRYQGEQRPLRSREDWDRHWRTQAVEQAAVVAFRWSLLPTRQAFAPGDYNWGMTSFGLAPASRFDLSLSLVIGGEPVQGFIRELECAPDF